MKKKPGKNGGRGIGSILPPLLYLLLAAFVVSSGMLGFVLGRNASGGTGELIDTIVLSPKSGVESGEEQITHFLSGRVLYSDDAPCAGVTVTLKNSAKSDTTDERGKFFISDVRSGQDVIEVLDEQGRLLADTELSLSFERGAAVKAEVTVSGAPSLELPEDSRMLEFTFVVDPEENSLTLNQESGYVVTTGGKVVNFSGRMLQMEENSFSVLPGGDIAGASGYVLLPSKDVMVPPGRGSVQTLPFPDGESGPVGTRPQENGSVILGDGVSVEGGGVVVFPDGEGQLGPTDHVIVVGDGTAEELPELPESYEPPAPADPSATAQPPEVSENPQEDRLPPPDQTSEEESREESVPSLGEEEPSQEEPETGTPPPEPTPEPTEDPFGISDLTTGISWKQQSIIDLFKNRTSGEELGEQDGVPMIAPGSSGLYEFLLQNDADYDVRFTIQISEQSFHLPILYSVKDMENGKIYMGGGKVGVDGSTIATNYILLPAHSARRYRLGWEWQYEDWLAPWEDDAFDISAAQSDDRTYIVSLGVDAEQVLAPY